MCVIAIKPEKVAIGIADIRQCWDSNPDGAGVMFTTPNGVRIIRGFTNPEILAQTLGSLKANQVVIHYRLRTHGKIDTDNCHPFPIRAVTTTPNNRGITARLGIVHNGIISGWGDTERSDTRQLVEDVLERIEDPDAIWKVLQSLQGYNKFAMLSPDTLYTVGSFDTHGECKYSNLYWRRTWAYQPKLEFPSVSNPSSVPSEVRYPPLTSQAKPQVVPFQRTLTDDGE
jgi:hypothetical protein